MNIRNLSAFILACAAAPLLAEEDYSAWRYSRSIVLNTTATGANVADPVLGFPLLVRLTPAHGEVFGNSLANGADVRFTKADGVTRLPHQVERWDKEKQLAEIWVQVDTVAGAGYTTLRMFWSNAAAADSSKGTQVFNADNGFVGVWHMGDAPAAGNRPNSAAGVNHAVPSGHSGRLALPPVDGIAGLADSLRGNGRGTGFIGDHFNLGAGFSGLGDNGAITFSMWVKPAPFGVNNSAKFLSMGNAGAQNVLWMGRRDSSGNKLAGESITSSGGGDVLQGAPNTLIPGAWQHVAYTVSNSGETHTLYLNGAPNAQDGNAQDVGDVARSLNYIGRSPWAADSTFRGVVDEVRISNVARDANWMRLSYETQKGGPTALMTTNDPVLTFRLRGPMSEMEYAAGNSDWSLHYWDGIAHSMADTLNEKRYQSTFSARGLRQDFDNVEGEFDFRIATDPKFGTITLTAHDDFMEGPPFYTTTLSPQGVIAHSLSAEYIYATNFVSTPKWTVPDYVFEKDYELRSLGELEEFVRTHKHLPDIPSARHIADKGLDLGEMNLRLLKSVEELTLHVIDLNKRNDRLEHVVETLRAEARGR